MEGADDEEKQAAQNIVKDNLCYFEGCKRIATLRCEYRVDLTTFGCMKMFCAEHTSQKVTSFGNK